MDAISFLIPDESIFPCMASLQIASKREYQSVCRLFVLSSLPVSQTKYENPIALFAAALWISPIQISQAQTGTPEFDPHGEYDDLPKLIRVQVEFIDVPYPVLTEKIICSMAYSR